MSQLTYHGVSLFSVVEGCKVCMRYTALAKIWSNIAELAVSVCRPLPTPPFKR